MRDILAPLFDIVAFAAASRRRDEPQPNRQHVVLRAFSRSGRTGRARFSLDFTAVTISVAEHIELELAYVRASNEQVRYGVAPPECRFVDWRVIGPGVPLRLAALSFNDQASIDRVYNWGVADGQAARVRRLS